VTLEEELERVARFALAHANEGDVVSGVVPTEPEPGRRAYVCSIDGADGYRGWLAVRDDGSPISERLELRAAVSVAALCEVAEDAAGGGALDDLIARLEELRRTDAPEGIEEALAAAHALRRVIGQPPQVASAARLDEIGAATRRLEQELDPSGASPFAAAMRSAQNAVGELQREVEAGYLIPLT
jgi:hypothetical protein